MTGASATVSAEETENGVQVETDYFSMMLPQDCYILKQTLDEESMQYLEKTGADKAQVEEYFKTAGIVLDAIAWDNTYEVVATVTQSQDVAYIYDMKSLSDETLTAFGETILKSYADYGYTTGDPDVYETADAKYVRLRFSLNGEDGALSSEQYYTILGNQVFHFTLRCYATDIPQELHEKMEQIIQNVRFMQTTDMRVYTNAEAGVTFSVKEGWNAAAEQTNETYIQMQYTNELGESISFLCMDLWGNLDVLHQFIHTREEMKIQHPLTEKEKKAYKEYLEVFFTDYEQAEQTEKNQVSYLTQDGFLTVEKDDGNGIYLQKSYVTIKNGILYVFRYGCYEGNGLHEADFHEMMETVSYKEAGLLEKDVRIYEQIALVGYGVITAMLLVVVILIFVIYLYITGYEHET